MFQFVFRSQNHVWHCFDVHVSKHVPNAAILCSWCWRSSSNLLFYFYTNKLRIISALQMFLLEFRICNLFLQSYKRRYI